MWSRISYRISSISKAAGNVSISTVALMLPVGMPSVSCANRNTSFHSRASCAALELGQIEIGAGALGELRLGVVEEIEAEIEQRARDRRAVDGQMRFGQVPAARAHDQHRRLRTDRVALVRVRIGEVDLDRAQRSFRLIWPSILFAQVGEFASSKSAM